MPTNGLEFQAEIDSEFGLTQKRGDSGSPPSRYVDRPVIKLVQRALDERQHIIIAHVRHERTIAVPHEAAAA
ncbi:hypothetical protein JCM9534A_35230 [Catenuloplanes indicus JCM 9534]